MATDAMLSKTTDALNRAADAERTQRRATIAATALLGAVVALVIAVALIAAVAALAAVAPVWATVVVTAAAAVMAGAAGLWAYRQFTDRNNTESAG